MPKPIFFLVHGANVGSFVFAPIIPLLWARGYGTWCLELPFHDGDPKCTATEVIAFIRTELEKLTGCGREIITVCWSFGAKIGPPAFEGLFKSSRQQSSIEAADTEHDPKRSRGGIVGMVFACCPLMERTGWSIKDNSARWETEKWFEGHKAEDLFEVTDALLVPKSGKDSPFARCMYSSLSPRIYPNPHELFDPVLRPLSRSTQLEPITYYPILKGNPEDVEEPGEWVVPTAYILAEEDKVIPPSLQAKMVSRWEKSRAKVYRINSGHMIWVSKPEESVEALVDFADSLESARDLCLIPSE